MSDLEENLAQPKLYIDLKQELNELKSAPSWSQNGRSAKTLVKYPDLRIILTVLKAGKRLVEHKAEGRLTIHTLSGYLKLRLGNETVDLHAGQVLALEQAIAHDVEALEESAFLITIAWPDRMPAA